MEDKEIIEPSVLASMLMRLFEFAPMAMAITTSDTKTSSYAKVNDAYLKLTGQRWEDICGKKLLAQGSAIDSPARDRRHRMLAEVGSFVLEEVDIRHVDGTILHEDVILPSIATTVSMAGSGHVNHFSFHSHSVDVEI